MPVRPTLMAAAIAALSVSASAQAAPTPLAGVAGVTGGPSSTLSSIYLPITSGLGDVDGDGRADVAFTSVLGEQPPTTKVLFGRPTTTNVDLTASDARVRTYPNTRVRPAGDVNGDGTNDVLVTVFSLTPSDTPFVTAVVFGGLGVADVRIDRLGGRGFFLTRLGRYSAAGDVNGDGRDDLFAQVESDDPSRGAGAIVFGKASSSPVDAAAPGAGGVKLSFASIGTTEEEVAPARGDINGDGIEDLAVQNRSGGAVVHFGRRSWPATLDGDAPGDRGFVIDGTYALLPDTLDFTGDGRADLLVYVGGATELLPGRSSTSRVDAGAAAFMVSPDGYNSPAWPNAAPVGDRNADGRDDLVVGYYPNTRIIDGQPAGPVGTGRVVPGTFAQILRPVGDIDGDNAPDALSAELPFFGMPGAYRPRHTLLTAKKDVLAPSWGWFSPELSPSSFHVGESVVLSESITEPATIDVTLRKASGALVGTFRIPVPTNDAPTWDGRINGRALPAGEYRATGTLVDAAGNRSDARSLTFTILP